MPYTRPFVTAFEHRELEEDRPWGPITCAVVAAGHGVDSAIVSGPWR
jgi:hypothetical protein